MTVKKLLQNLKIPSTFHYLTTLFKLKGSLTLLIISSIYSIFYINIGLLNNHLKKDDVHKELYYHSFTDYKLSNVLSIVRCSSWL